MRKRGIKQSILVLGMLALLLVVPVGILAKDHKPERPIGPNLLAPFGPARALLSGRFWLIASGSDEFSFLLDRKDLPDGLEGIRAQAPGAGAVGLVPFRDPAAKFSRNILITEDFSGLPLQTEPHLTVNPKDPDHLVMGTIDYNFPNPTAYVSIDGGESWEGPFQPRYPRSQAGAAGDPVMGFDSQGNPHYAFITVDVEEFSLGSLVGSALVSSISLSSSDDGGFTWGEAIPSSTSSVYTIELPPEPDGRLRGVVGFEFLDKPWMDIGPSPDDPDKDIIYITYTKFTTEYQISWVDELPFLTSPLITTRIEMVKSEDGGVSWSEPLQVSPTALRTFGDRPQTEADTEQGEENDGGGQTQQYEDAEGGRRFVQGSQPTVAPDGTVYISWLDTTNDNAFEGIAEIYVTSSNDAGETFGKPVRASTFLEIPFRPRNVFFRYWGAAFPRITTGQEEGEVYVVFTAIPTDKPNDDGDIFLVSSFDGGKTWSRKVSVNDDDTSRLQFFPEVSVAPDGAVHVMWGDMRDDPNEVRYHIYYATSKDKGESWEVNARVTDFPSNPNFGFPRGLFIGDYFAIQAIEDDVYMVWADTRLGEFGGVNQKIGFARQRLMPSPSIFISPPSGPGGRDVIIQGFDFQPRRNIFIEVAGSIVATGRTNGNGQFSSGIFIPISGEGAHRVRVIEESGNVASSSFFMDFGFDNLQDATEQIQGVADKVASLEGQIQAIGLSQSGGSAADLKRIEDSLDQLKALQETLQEQLTTIAIVKSGETLSLSPVEETQVVGESEGNSRTGLVFGLAGSTAVSLLAAGALGVMLVRRNNHKSSKE